MKKDSYKRSWLTRQLWIGVGLFFVLVFSCPVKRLVKLHLYKESSDWSSTNSMYSKELKDCNLIDKKGAVSMTMYPFFHGPDPLPSTTTLPVTLFLSFLIASELFLFFQRKSRRASFSFIPAVASSSVPLYLRVHRIQV